MKKAATTNIRMASTGRSKDLVLGIAFKEEPTLGHQHKENRLRHAEHRAEDDLLFLSGVYGISR